MAQRPCHLRKEARPSSLEGKVLPFPLRYRHKDLSNAQVANIYVHYNPPLPSHTFSFTGPSWVSLPLLVGYLHLPTLSLWTKLSWAVEQPIIIWESGLHIPKDELTSEPSYHIRLESPRQPILRKGTNQFIPSKSRELVQKYREQSCAP